MIKGGGRQNNGLGEVLMAGDNCLIGCFKIIKDRRQRGARFAFILAGGLCFKYS